MSDTLTEHLAWLESITGKPCICRYELRGSRLYGRSLGKSWVRMNTDPTCPEHGKAGRPDRTARRSLP